MNYSNNKKEFATQGYTLVKNAVSQELTELLTQYALFDEMQDFTPDSIQVPKAHSKYGDPAMEALLLRLQPVIEGATGLDLSPTYSFYRVYRNGDELLPHKDRQACEISITLCFNYSYDDSKYSWPIFMDGEGVNLKPGDLVVYRGVDKEHWREKFNCPEDAWHVQGFFHYVDVNGPYANYIYDERPSIGMPFASKKVPQGQTEKTTDNTRRSYIEYTK
jgi:hypothetical protein